MSHQHPLNKGLHRATHYPILDLETPSLSILGGQDILPWPLSSLMPFYHPAKLTALGKSGFLIFLSDSKKRKLDFQMPTASAKRQAGPSDPWERPASAPDTWKRLRHVATCSAFPTRENENSSDVELILQMSVFQLPKFGNRSFPLPTAAAFASAR